MPSEFYFEIRYINFDEKLQSHLLSRRNAQQWQVTLKSVLFWFYWVLKIYENSRILLNFKRPGTDFSIYGDHEHGQGKVLESDAFKHNLANRNTGQGGYGHIVDRWGHQGLKKVGP